MATKKPDDQPTKPDDEPDKVYKAPELKFFNVNVEQIIYFVCSCQLLVIIGLIVYYTTLDEVEHKYKIVAVVIVAISFFTYVGLCVGTRMQHRITILVSSVAIGVMVVVRIVFSIWLVIHVHTRRKSGDYDNASAKKEQFGGQKSISDEDVAITILVMIIVTTLNVASLLCCNVPLVVAGTKYAEHVQSILHLRPAIHEESRQYRDLNTEERAAEIG